jgi:hypothetical protein
MPTYQEDFLHAREKLDAALARDELPSCALDENGIKAQQERHARLAPSVTGLEWSGATVVFTFGEDYDRQALDEMIAEEEKCCPFFRFGFDPHERKLAVGIEQPEMLPALEAIASHLGAHWQGQSGPV